MHLILTTALSQARCLIFQQCDLDLRNVGDTGIEHKFEVHVSHHAGFGQDQLEHVLVPTGAEIRARQCGLRGRSVKIIILIVNEHEGVCTCRSAVSRCVCAVRRLRGVVGGGAEGGVSAAAPAAPPPSRAAPWPRSAALTSRSASAPPARRASPRSGAALPGGQLLHTHTHRMTLQYPDGELLPRVLMMMRG